MPEREHDLARDAAELRSKIAELASENARLRRLLQITSAEARQAPGSQTAWFDHSPGPVNRESSPADKVAFFAELFRSRRDVYATYWENPRTGRRGWSPATAGPWRKGAAHTDRHYLPLTADVIEAHLLGTTRIGLYPMLPGDQTHWLAADFDGTSAMLDALAYLKAARSLSIPASLEISRSGIGAHVWIFFSDPVPASAARQIGAGLLREAMALTGRMNLRSYDRLFPSQDTVPSGRFGNLIAAPLNGQSRNEHHTTLFLNLATLEPHGDQFEFLSSLDRLNPRRVARLANQLGEPTVGMRVDRLRATASTRIQPQPAEVVQAILDGGVRIRIDDLTPSASATLKHAASLANPEFYERQRRRQSTWNVPRFIQSYDETLDGHLVLPRGLREVAEQIVREAGSSVEIVDNRAGGTAIDPTFTATLTPHQHAAVADLVAHDLGVLVAPPGSGKTVMACAAIAHHAVSTLVLVDRKALADQWRTQVQALLGIKPGQLGGGRTKLTGVVDIMTLQTLSRRTDLAEVLAGYGLVVADECHHIPAAAFELAVRAVPAQRWLGLTATPYRRDRLDDLIAFQLGPVRHTLNPPAAGTIEGAAVGRPEPVLHLHETTFSLPEPLDPSLPGAMPEIYRAQAEDGARNLQVVDDVVGALERGRHCLVLTRYVSHIDRLATMLTERGHTPITLKGGMSAKARAVAMASAQDPDRDRPLLIVATGSYVGEGVDIPALDTVFLVGSPAHKGAVVQYVGRILRSHPGKTSAEVHDYHDIDVPVLASALAKRTPGYAALGFPDPRRR